MVRSTVRWNSNRNTTLPPLTVSADQIMSGWRRWSVFLLTSPVDSSRSVEKSISVAHSGAWWRIRISAMRRSAKTDLRKASCMESPGRWGLQVGGGVRAFGWLDGPDWGREAERIGQLVSRSPLMSTALYILSIIVHTLCATIVVARGVFTIIRDRQDSLAPFRPAQSR